MKYKDLINDILLEMGILVNEADDDYSIQTYIVDSIQFITFIVNLEEKLNIIFPDELLSYDSISSINTLSQIIELVIESSED